MSAKSVVLWNAFLPVAKPLLTDEAPVDPTWLAVRGIDALALPVLRVVRRSVLPLVRRLRRKLDGFSFLVHDRTSGVPCAPEDHGAYVHLRLRFKKASRAEAVQHLLPTEWVHSKEVAITVDGSCDCAKAGSGACRILESQSALYLEILERDPSASDLDALAEVRQHLHFFSNMSQMRIS